MARSISSAGSSRRPKFSIANLPRMAHVNGPRRAEFRPARALRGRPRSDPSAPAFAPRPAPWKTHRAMKHFVVAAAYATWLVLINVVFYLVHGRDLGPQEYSVLAGVVPMGLQLLLLGFDPIGMVRPARMMCLFVLIVLLSYLFNGADWSGVVY